MRVSKEMPTGSSRPTERGIALITSLLFLVLLSAMAVGLMYMSTTDTQINANFRNEQQIYYAARAGMEELRDRMATYNANSISASLPTVAPTTSNSASVVYLVNEGTNTGSVSPWNSSNQYKDTELCHDGYPGLGLTATAVDVPCTGSGTLPSSGSYTKFTSQLPWAGTNATIPYKWARVTLKLANTNPQYPVNQNAPTSTKQVCWTGAYQVELPTGYASCGSMSPSNTPVYVITALAVNPNSGARKMVQGEVAMQPAGTFAYGLFATGSGCGAVTLGGNSSTDAYDSSLGQYGSNGNVSYTAGGVGSNGNVLVNGGATIGGNVGSPISPSVSGACPGAPMTLNGSSGGLYPGVGDQILPITSVSVAAPTIPSTSGPNKNNPTTLSPGNYGNISLTSNTNLTLSAGTYNINSISESGQAKITITGPVVLNVQGSNINGNPPVVVDLTGGGFVNSTSPMLPSNFQINYAGSGLIKMAGGSSAAVAIDAPNAQVTLSGNSTYYGAILANQISLGGGAQFHYDTHTQLPIPLSTYYTLLTFREVYY